MYIRPVHAELSVEKLHTFIKANAFGLITTHLPHPTIASLQSTHIPFVIDAPEDGLAASVDHDGKAVPGKPLGKVRGHMARANPQCRAMLDALSAPSAASTAGSSYLPSFLTRTASSASSSPPTSGQLGEEVLIIFQSPHHSYVTPKFYKETKPATGKVVPTWDYAAVQVYGRLTVYDKGPESSAFLATLLDDLSEEQEKLHAQKKADRTGCPMEETWKVQDAPQAYRDQLQKGIIGLEVEITRIEGRFKLSQENTDGDWEGVVQGFKEIGEVGMVRMFEETGSSRAVRQSQDMGP
jgi:transcriptional regulator